jgi:hypothetical protein
MIYRVVNFIGNKQPRLKEKINWQTTQKKETGYTTVLKLFICLLHSQIQQMKEVKKNRLRW